MSFLPHFKPKTPTKTPKTPTKTPNCQKPRQKLPTAKNLSMHRLGVSFAKNSQANQTPFSHFPSILYIPHPYLILVFFYRVTKI
jgi:hypothetical protein